MKIGKFLAVFLDKEHNVTRAANTFGTTPILSRVELAREVANEKHGGIVDGWGETFCAAHHKAVDLRVDHWGARLKSNGQIIASGRCRAEAIELAEDAGHHRGEFEVAIMSDELRREVFLGDNTEGSDAPIYSDIMTGRAKRFVRAWVSLMAESEAA